MIAVPRRLNYPEAAAFVGVKLSTLRSLVSRGQVPHIRLTARLVVFDEKSLGAWLESKRVDVGGAA